MTGNWSRRSGRGSRPYVVHVEVAWPPTVTATWRYVAVEMIVKPTAPQAVQIIFSAACTDERWSRPTASRPRQMLSTHPRADTRRVGGTVGEQPVQRRY